MDPDPRIVAADSARPEFGPWYAHLRPAAGYRKAGFVFGPLLLVIQVIGWPLTLRAAIFPPRDFGGACFGLIFLGPLAVMAVYIYVSRIASRRYVYVSEGAVRLRIEFLHFRWDRQVASLDQIHTLDFGGCDNFHTRGLLIGYTAQQTYLRFALLGDLTLDETLGLIDLLKAHVSPEVDSALLHGARTEGTRVVRDSGTFVITPGIPPRSKPFLWPGP